MSGVASPNGSQTLTAFHVIETGDSCYFTTEGETDILTVAQRLRSYLSIEDSATHDSLCEQFRNRDDINTERFDELVGIRMDNTGKVAQCYDVDLDKREFSAVHIMDGWKTYAVADVSVAAYHANRSQHENRDTRFQKLIDFLDGKEITSAGHLSSRNISFSEEIMEMDDRLNFYIDVSFNVDAVFGTNVCTTENDDWLNVYANYDMASGTVCDTLDIELHRGDGAEEELIYTLNAAEKDVILRNMDDYCQVQTGMTLSEYSAQRMSEYNAPQMGQLM